MMPAIQPKSLLFFYAVLVCVSSFAAAPTGTPAPPWAPATAAAVARWQAMRFGLFIHWGPASLTGNEISWSRGGTSWMVT